MYVPVFAFVSVLNDQIEDMEELLQKQFGLEELSHIEYPTQVRHTLIQAEAHISFPHPT